VAELPEYDPESSVGPEVTPLAEPFTIFSSFNAAPVLIFDDAADLRDWPEPG